MVRRRSAFRAGSGSLAWASGHNLKRGTPMSVMLPDLSRPPLTVLSEEEAMFRDAVRQFAEETVAPRVHAMDEAQKMDPGLIPQFFELGLMGDRGAGGAAAAPAPPSSPPCWWSRSSRGWIASVGVLVDVQNTLVNNAFLRWGTRRAEGEVPAAARRARRWAPTRSPRPAPAPTPSRSPTRAVEADGGWRLTGSKLWITNGAEAELFIVFANAEPGGRLPRHHGLHRGAGLRRLLRGQEGGQARHPRVAAPPS